MHTFASIALLALVAPIFAVPFEQLEARDDPGSSVSSPFAAPTTEVPNIGPLESLFSSQLTIAPTATHHHRRPLHTGGTEEGEHRHTRSHHPFPSGTGFPHHTHHTHTHTHTGTFKLHPTGRPHEGFERHHDGEEYEEYDSFIKSDPSGEPNAKYENRISSFRFSAVTNLIHSHYPY